MNSENSKYQRWYDGLIAFGKRRGQPAGYYEVHHILPRSFGGNDDPTNLVKLKYREHFLAHWLLCKMHTGPRLLKMQRALWAMALPVSSGRKPTNWQFDVSQRAMNFLELMGAAKRAGIVDREQLIKDHARTLCGRQISADEADRLLTEPAPARRRRKRPRPGKRYRMRVAAERAAAS